MSLGRSGAGPESAKVLGSDGAVRSCVEFLYEMAA